MAPLPEGPPPPGPWEEPELELIPPDKNCYTLPNGECIGTNCMHDPDE